MHFLDCDIPIQSIKSFGPNDNRCSPVERRRRRTSKTLGSGCGVGGSEQGCENEELWVTHRFSGTACAPVLRVHDDSHDRGRPTFPKASCFLHLLMLRESRYLYLNDSTFCVQPPPTRRRLFATRFLATPSSLYRRRPHQPRWAKENINTPRSAWREVRGWGRGEKFSLWNSLDGGFVWARVHYSVLCDRVCGAQSSPIRKLLHSSRRLPSQCPKR